LDTRTFGLTHNSVSIEVLVTSAEDAAAGIGEPWLDGELPGTTRVSDDHGIVLDLREGPWELDLGDFHRALERLEDALAWERPAAP
jgi:hypothetical protein